jgi:plasmid stabilization system protein ParE
VKERRVVFAPEAVHDLNELYDWISSQASPTVAMRYLERVEAFCRRLGVASERGHLENAAHNRTWKTGGLCQQRGDLIHARPDGSRRTGLPHRPSTAMDSRSTACQRGS